MYYRDHLTKTYHKGYFKGKRDLKASRIEKTVLFLGKVSGKVILDLGCGTGEGSILLRNRGADVVCVDIARYAIDTCHKKGFSGVIAAVHCLPFKNSLFDGILFMDVIEHIPRKLVRQTLREMKTILKSDGRIAIHTMPNLFLEKLSILYGMINRKHWRRWRESGGHVNTYTVWKLKKDIRMAGLEIVRFDIGLYPSDAPFPTIGLLLSRLTAKFFGNDFWIFCKAPKLKKEKIAP
jgi:2-polyprenyl-3-methyl-5-hydroxy-6-metoxy-1,4-benzoquinol methylase